MISYFINKGSYKDIFKHLQLCNLNFFPSLDSRVSLDLFAKKIIEKAVRFEAWEGSLLVGLLSCYFNDTKKSVAYINHVSVINWKIGLGLSKQLLEMCIAYKHNNKFQCIELEVNADNFKALGLYKKYGFYITHVNANSIFMRYEVDKGLFR